MDAMTSELPGSAQSRMSTATADALAAVAPLCRTMWNEAWVSMLQVFPLDQSGVKHFSHVRGTEVLDPHSCAV